MSAEASTGDRTSPHEGQIGILKRREIEANIIAPIYGILVREFGRDRARDIIREAITADAVKSGAEFAAREDGEANLQSFIAIQHLWEQDDALKVEVHAADADTYRYDVKRCRYAEMYKALGLAEIGTLLSCTRDYEFTKGYDPRIRLQRTQTIMEGASHCDFHYRAEGGAKRE